MKNRKYLLLAAILSLVIAACESAKKNEEDSKWTGPKTGYGQAVAKGKAASHAYDDYNKKLEEQKKMLDE